jgi:hypothetical protein
MPNSWEETCTTKAGEARESPDTSVREISVSATLQCTEEAFDLRFSGEKLTLEYSEGGGIRFGPSTNDHVHGRDPLQDILADDLPESSLQLISLHNRATMLGNDEAYAGMAEKGSDDSEV